MPLLDDNFSLAERELQAVNQLSEAQLRWRRWCLAANCGGDENVFAQEYPASPEEAFLTSGRPVFNMRALAAAYADAPEARRGRVAEQNGQPIFVEGEGNYLYLYQEPEPGRDYVIGIDVAAGYRGGDYSAMAVLDKESLCLMAMWHGHIEPELLGEEAELLGRYYARALLAPEANNHGIAVLNTLRRVHYGHVQRRANGEMGFLTTAKSKAELVAKLASYIRSGATRIRDKGTLKECMTYIYDEKGHTNAQAGQHDDRVMALGLALSTADSGGRGPKIPEMDWAKVYGICETTGY